jgi:hypothetical protein
MGPVRLRRDPRKRHTGVLGYNKHSDGTHAKRGRFGWVPRWSPLSWVPPVVFWSPCPPRFPPALALLGCGLGPRFAVVVCSPRLGLALWLCAWCPARPGFPLLVVVVSPPAARPPVLTHL